MAKARDGGRPRGDLPLAQGPNHVGLGGPGAGRRPRGYSGAGWQRGQR